MKQKNFLMLMVLLGVLIFIPMVVFSNTIDLPKTGQTLCYDPDPLSGAVIPCAGTGQDGELQDPVGADIGVAWPTTGTSASGRFQDNADGTITDLLTGLMWTQNANLPTVAVSWTGCRNYVNGMNGGGGTYGYTDWRFANMLEMDSLTNSGVADASVWLNSEGFTNVMSSWYWGSNGYAGSGGSGWRMSMINGELTTSGLQGGLPADSYCLPVRDGQNPDPDLTYPANTRKSGATTSSVQGDDADLEWGVAWPDPRFTNNCNGTHSDEMTMLMWTTSGNLLYDKDPNSPRAETWLEALDWAASMNSGAEENFGWNDWRIPNRTELLSLTNWEGESSNLGIYGFTNIYGGLSNWGKKWTSTTDPSFTDNVFCLSLATGGQWMESSRKETTGFGNWSFSCASFWPVRNLLDTPYEVGVCIEPVGAGSVTGAGFNCPPDCEESYEFGASGIVLTATPVAGSVFEEWTNCDDDVSQAPDCVMDASSRTKGVYANFIVPDIGFDPLALDFGNVAVGDTVSRTITISNNDFFDYTVAESPAFPPITNPSAPFTLDTDNCTDTLLAGFIARTGNPYTGGTGFAFNNTGNYSPTDSPTCGGSLWRMWLNRGHTTPPPPIGSSWNRGLIPALVTDEMVPGSAVLNISVRGVGWMAVPELNGIFEHAAGLVAGENYFNMGSRQLFLHYTDCANRVFNDNGRSYLDWVDYPAGAQTCDLDISFSPASEGDFNSSMDVPGLKPIALTGAGVTAPPGTNPDIDVSTNDLAFGSLYINDTVVQTLTVMNEGDATLNFTSITIPASQFSVDTDNCSPSLAAAASCTIDVEYASTALPAGPHTAVLAIVSDDPDEGTVNVNLSGSTLAGGNTLPTKPVLISPANGAVVPAAGLFNMTWTDATDPDICTAPNVPSGCDDTQLLTNTLYLATDPAFQNLITPVAGIETGISYAAVFGNPVFMIALFSILALGVFMKRRKVTMLLIAVVFAMGLLFVSCANHKDSGETSGAGSAQAVVAQGQTYYWKVIADDSQGGITESDTWSFTTQ